MKFARVTVEVVDVEEGSKAVTTRAQVVFDEAKTTIQAAVEAISVKAAEEAASAAQMVEPPAEEPPAEEEPVA